MSFRGRRKPAQARPSRAGRPWVVIEVGIAAAAICLCGVVAALVLAGSRGAAACPVVTVAVVLVAASRLYRGAHYPSDIAGSLLFARPWLYVVLRELPLRAVTAGHGVGEWRA
jgi:membrane-associated phospholipid phosphatase